jgi:hypothetical protein
MGDDGAVDETPPGRGWAPPGAAADGSPLPPPPSGAPPPGGPPDAPATTVVSGRPPVPVVGLRPMTVADVLDGGFAVIKARPRRILGLTAAFVIPTHLVIGLVQRAQLRSVGAADIWSADPTVFGESDETFAGGDGVTFLVGIGLPALVLVFVAAALGHLVVSWTVGRDPSAGEMAAVAARRWWALLASFVVVHLAEGLGLLACGIGLLFVMPMFAAVAPVIGAEGTGPLAAVSRSWRLARARYWPTLGLVLIMGVVATILSTALSALPQGLATLAGADGGWVLLVVGAIVSEVVVVPFVAAATVLLYLDLRVRTEGLDIELGAIELFDRAG